jgi:hypothetical protein
LALASTCKEYATGVAREARRAKTLALPRLAAACPKSVCRFGRPKGHIITFTSEYVRLAPGGTGKTAMARMAMAMARESEWSVVESQSRGAVHVHIPMGQTCVCSVALSRVRSAAEDQDSETDE